ncbi:MAG: amidohydrolase, partial [Candidatus Eisenbacteria bacterium]
AIVGARIVPAPGQVIERGTVVIRDGVIVAVGPHVAVPADARIWKADSLTVYPGLIDAFVAPPPEAPRAQREGTGRRQRQAAEPEKPKGAGHALASVHPEFHMAEALPLDKDQVEALRAAGFAAVQAVPRDGILRGQSAVAGLEDGSPRAAVLEEDAMQVIALEPAPEGYPGSLMGAIAVVRQAFLDARWYGEVQATYARSPQGKERPETNVSLEALQPTVKGTRPALFVADEMLEVLRSAAIAREAGVKAVVVGAGDEYKRVSEIAAAGMALVVPVTFPEPPDLSDPDQAVEVSTEELRHWYRAPENAAILARHGVPFALTANGLKDVKAFRARVGQAIERGLTPAEALAAVTTTPARILGLSDRLGTIGPGKIANLTVVRGDLFSEKSKVRDVWVDGDRYEVTKDDGGVAGRWQIENLGPKAPRLDTLLVAVDKDTTVKRVSARDTVVATSVHVDGQSLRFRLGVDALDVWTVQLTAANDAVTGVATSAKGERSDVRGRKLADESAKKKKDEPIATPAVMGITEAWRMPPPPQPPAVLVRNATIWTAGPKGTLANADLLVRAGKIAAVGSHLAAPARAVVIDAAGKHVAPGIIDEHSHAAILGDVNECTNVVTCEVRIQDVVNSESPNIYRQLAGGTTIMHLLHGSCNAIGGQCAVIKNRWGEPPERLLFTAAPPTVKFALGENPKQSNWGADANGRYPQSRGGVEQTIRDAFLRAADYRAAWDEYRRHRRPLPPRRDLQLEALDEVLAGKRLVHVHSYRQDEILMLMRLAETFGFRINTFTHVLEGYKVADELAAHGASALGFSDWWAYKFEVIDAIPYSGYLMWDRGVNTGFNSDDPELARRLNTEAAKAVKYGGVPPEQAIQFVTLNPAKSLKIDDRVGSLEVGKDADFAIWSGSPLSPLSVCEQTWIEGRKYFDRAADLAGRSALARERDALIARAKAATKEGGESKGEKQPWPPRYLEETNLSGDDCQGTELPYQSEGERRALAEHGGSEGGQR